MIRCELYKNDAYIKIIEQLDNHTGIEIARLVGEGYIGILRKLKRLTKGRICIRKTEENYLCNRKYYYLTGKGQALQYLIKEYRDAITKLDEIERDYKKHFRGI